MTSDKYGKELLREIDERQKEIDRLFEIKKKKKKRKERREYIQNKIINIPISTYNSSISYMKNIAKSLYSNVTDYKEKKDYEKSILEKEKEELLSNINSLLKTDNKTDYTEVQTNKYIKNKEDTKTSTSEEQLIKYENIETIDDKIDIKEKNYEKITENKLDNGEWEEKDFRLELTDNIETIDDKIDIKEKNYEKITENKLDNGEWEEKDFRSELTDNIETIDDKIIDLNSEDYNITEPEISKIYKEFKKNNHYLQEKYKGLSLEEAKALDDYFYMGEESKSVKKINQEYGVNIYKILKEQEIDFRRVPLIESSEEKDKLEILYVEDGLEKKLDITKDDYLKKSNQINNLIEVLNKIVEKKQKKIAKKPIAIKIEPNEEQYNYEDNKIEHSFLSDIYHSNIIPYIEKIQIKTRENKKRTKEIFNYLIEKIEDNYDSLKNKISNSYTSLIDKKESAITRLSEKKDKGIEKLLSIYQSIRKKESLTEDKTKLEKTQENNSRKKIITNYENNFKTKFTELYNNIYSKTQNSSKHLYEKTNKIKDFIKNNAIPDISFNCLKNISNYSKALALSTCISLGLYAHFSNQYTEYEKRIYDSKNNIALISEMLVKTKEQQDIINNEKKVYELLIKEYENIKEPKIEDINQIRIIKSDIDAIILKDKILNKEISNAANNFRNYQEIINNGNKYDSLKKYSGYSSIALLLTTIGTVIYRRKKN
jgi:hypothetical protein